MNHVLLDMTDICKSFPGVKALDHAALCVKAGSVHALMGENGAGKSTLMKCLFGVYSKDSGSIRLDGQEVHFKNPKEALDNGVAMVHQELNQALVRSVADNMWSGRFPTLAHFFPFVDEKRMVAETQRIFDELGLDIDPRVTIGTLSVSLRQMVEIARAVSCKAKILVLDEPTSSLNDREVEVLFRIIRMLRDRGCGIIYISHKMEEILQISDEVTVMRDGKHIATRPAGSLSTDEIIRLMVGRELTERYPARYSKVGEELLRVEHLSGIHARVDDVSFTVRQGEIVGIAGLGGAGRTSLLSLLFGVAAKKSGRIFLNGKEVQNTSPRAALRNGFAYVTEERRADGIFGILDICANTTISSLEKHRRFGFLSARRLAKSTEECIRSMRVKTPSQKTKIRTLSGGNQQKVIFGRWLLTEPTVLLLDEPTRGIDVGAKYEIYELILKLAAEGKTVLMVSSEMPELLGMCDRILVMSGGRLAGEVDNTASQEQIMALAARFA